MDITTRKTSSTKLKVATLASLLVLAGSGYAVGATSLLSNQSVSAESNRVPAITETLKKYDAALLADSLDSYMGTSSEQGTVASKILDVEFAGDSARAHIATTAPAGLGGYSDRSQIAYFAYETEGGVTEGFKEGSSVSYWNIVGVYEADVTVEADFLSKHGLPASWTDQVF